MQNKLIKSKLNIFYALMACVFAVAMQSCTTQKNTFFFRSYHGICTRYNIFFNGNESYKEAVEVIDFAVKDNYTSILPVFNAPDKTEALKSSPQLDRTIEKCSKAIKKHSMFIRGVEHCKPIPNTYLLMGKAYFKRQDYADASSIFSYIINTHDNSKVWCEAHTWKARTYLATNRLDDAQEMLETARIPVSNSKKKQYRLHWLANFADYYLKVKEYEQASIYLTEVLHQKRIKKDFKTRVSFILGQVYQQLEQHADAAKQYAYVIKRTPPYEMEFNAAINLALCSPEKSKYEKTAYDKLRKMLKDERNATYRDQIFYAMSQLDLRNEETDKAIKNLEASVFWSMNNPHQKTLSALKLAEIYFAENQYIDAEKYYDTVVGIIPKTYPNYTEIRERARILKNLVQNLMVIKTEDDLQRIANMDEKERNKHISKLIDEYRKREEDRKADEEEKKQMMETANNQRNAAKAGNASGQWLFYNPTLVKQGMQSFRNRWGNRKLEDFWSVNELSAMNAFNNIAEDNKQEAANEEENTTGSTEKKTPLARTSDPENPAFYLQDVPFTEEQMAASNDAVAVALYNAGMIYFDDLNEAEKAVKLLEELVKRYPEHKLYPLACFQLYKLYIVLNNSEKSNFYKNIILEKFSDSDYAKIINDPDYYKKLATVREQGNLFYSSVYEAFKKSEYNRVVSLADEGLKKYPTPELSPKFDFLRTIALGKLNGNDTLKPLLEKISRNYPLTEIDTAAVELLKLLKQMEVAKPAAKDTTQQQAVEQVQSLYFYDEQAIHFVIVIVNMKDMGFEQLKSRIAAFGRDFFRLDKFEINSFYLDNTLQMITISNFQNKSKAMDYYNLMKVDTKYLESLNSNPEAKIYVISDVNYNPFYKNHQNKDKRTAYDAFFKEYYLK